jgi:hypothetical protein
MLPLARRIVLLALAGGVLFDILVPGNAAGLNAPLLMVAFLAAALATAGRDGLARMDPADAWLGPVALVLASMSALRADDWLVTVDLLLAAALAAGAIGCLAGGRITRGLVPRVLELAVGVVAAAGVGAAAVLAAARSRSQAGPAVGRSRVRRRLRPLAPVARGLVIAIPVLAVFVALFASADAVFARFASDVLSWQLDLDFEDLLGRAMLITLIAWGAAGLLGLGAGLLPALAPTSLAGSSPSAAAPPAGRAAAAASEDSLTGNSTEPLPGGPPSPPPAWGAPGAGWASAVTTADRAPLRLGSVEATTVLLVVDALFAIFVALQLAWLFGGRDTLALTGLTYAEYARRGFFDLVIVAVLAGMLVVTLDLGVARRTRLQLAGALLLLGLTAVILVSALLRLRLYQEAYGWTELRFVVLVAIAWLGGALALTASLLAARRTRWVLHGLGIGVAVAVLGMNAVGPQAVVAQRNLERAIDPSLVAPGGRTGLDAAYLDELGDEAVAPIVDAWKLLGDTDRAALEPVLRMRADRLAVDPEVKGWPAWNLTRERAREALRAWEAATGTASR